MSDNSSTNLSRALFASTVITSLIALSAIGIGISEPLTRLLQFDRAAILTGELWRLVTCHLTHWSLDHLLWDVIAFLTLGFLCERRDRKQFLVTLACSPLLISLFVWKFETHVATYRGLSGIDSALFVLLAISILREGIADGERHRISVAVIALIGFGAKTLFELTSGATVFVDSAVNHMTPLPWVHVVGAVCGILSAMKLPTAHNTATSSVTTSQSALKLERSAGL